MKKKNNHIKVKYCWEGFERITYVLYTMTDEELDIYNKLDTVAQRSAALDKISKKCSS